MDTPTDGPTQIETINKAGRVEVTYRDGKKEVIEIKQFSVRELVKYSEVETDEAASAELIAGKKSGWADLLENECVYMINREWRRVNHNPFLRHIQALQEKGEWNVTLLGTVKK